MTEFPEIEIKSIGTLRAWLEAHHETSGTVWLVTWKKHTDHYVPFDDVVTELLCWGWVDAVTRRVDEDRSSYRIAPRNPKSAWSAVNKRKVDEARAAGRMTEAGERAIRIAQDNGMWDFLNDVEALIVPDDLAKALKGVENVWDAYPRSVKRGTLEWIKTAKTAPTRTKRIAQIVVDAAEGLRPKPFRR